MARNQEKAQSMLFKFREAQLVGLGLARDRNRPRFAGETMRISDCEAWRQDVVTEIARKVDRIMDPALNEFQIREYNDEINRLFRHKYMWESRIVELGGPDYRHSGGRMLDNEGKEVPGSGGYRYFGRAKDLPGVRELFEAQVPEAMPTVRHQLYKRVDAGYYGYTDEDDGRLVIVEAEREPELLKQGLKALEERPLFREDVPSQQHMSAWLLQRRKMELMGQYV